MAMRKVDFEALMNQLRIELTGASDSGIKFALYHTFHEFFNDSSAWQETIVLPMQQSIVDYDIAPAEDGQIIRLVGVVDQNNVPQPALLTQVGLANGAGHIVFEWAPNLLPNGQTQSFLVTVAKNVVRPNSRDNIPIAPEWVLPIYERTILDGVQGKMMNQPGTSYSNDAKAKYHLARFRDGIAMARTAVLRRNTFGSQAWSFPQTFKVGTQRGGVSSANPNRF